MSTETKKVKTGEAKGDKRMIFKSERSGVKVVTATPKAPPKRKPDKKK